MSKQVLNKTTVFKEENKEGKNRSGPCRRNGKLKGPFLYLEITGYQMQEMGNVLEFEICVKGLKARTGAVCHPKLLCKDDSQLGETLSHHPVPLA